MSILSLLLTIILDMGIYLFIGTVSLSALTSSRSTKLERRNNILENVSSHYDLVHGFKYLFGEYREYLSEHGITSLVDCLGTRPSRMGVAERRNQNLLDSV